MLPYLHPTDCPRWVGHVGGPVVRGHEDVATRSTSAISFFLPREDLLEVPDLGVEYEVLCSAAGLWWLGLVPSGGSGIGRTKRSSGIDLIKQGLGNSIGAGTDSTEWELENLNGVGTDPTERADPIEQGLGNSNGVGADPTECGGLRT
ncbi:hypothetical protein B296_00042035 [Ensete ventricosum]|uniref:Uncharacterized protein n=1 Tax=Ensete ventricosum TaxID=4639 RepID=A0A426XA03_ENSVE|nr:hypothetical protein B296_00042035 [Ensete ventricosum]